MIFRIALFISLSLILAQGQAQEVGCTDPNAINFNPSATVDDGSCIYGIYGCTAPAALNYDPVATVDDGSCVYVVYGCTDLNAINYNPMANADDGSCYYNYYGCTDPNAANYDPAANVDDGSCQFAYDCYGEVNGSAYFDDCGQCVGGNTGIEPCMVTSVSESASGHFSVYPNPTNGQLTLQLPSALEGAVLYQLTDLSGRVVLSHQARVISGASHALQLNVPNGTYFLHANHSDGTRLTARVVVRNM